MKTLKRIALVLVPALFVCALAMAQSTYGDYGLVSGGGGGGISPPAGQIGGTTGSPTVLGIRETSGPTLLTTGTITDGEYLKRSGSTLISGTPAGGSSTFSKHFAADMVIATTASWPITSPAPLSGTQLNLANYRTFDASTAQGFGWELPLASGVTGITVLLDSAAATSGFTSNNAAIYGMACRQKGSSASFTTQLASAAVYADSTAVQRHTLSFTLAGLSLTAGTTALCNWHRAAANGGDTLTAVVNGLDWFVSTQ